MEYPVIEAMLRTRAEAGLSQAEAAARAGTTQSAIARLKGGSPSPVVETLQKYAKAVGKRLRLETV